MTTDPTLVLALAATAADGLLAGASLDQSLKQLPARHRLGSAALTIGAAGAARRQRRPVPAPAGAGSAFLLRRRRAGRAACAGHGAGCPHHL